MILGTHTTGYNYRRITKVTAPVTFGFSRQKGPSVSCSRYGFWMPKNVSDGSNRFRQSGRVTHEIKIHNNLSPSYLRRIFTNTSIVHAHNLRNSEINCYVPRPRTEYAKGSLHYRGSVLWNKIPSEIRHLSSLKLFKTSLNGKDYF